MLDDFITAEEEEIAEGDASLDPMDASLGSKTISKAGKFSGTHGCKNEGGCPNLMDTILVKSQLRKKTEILDTIEELLDKGDWTGDRSTIPSKMGSSINVSCHKHGYKLWRKTHTLACGMKAAFSMQNYISTTWH